ncbi:hypothetical protein ACFC7A_19595 [Streptomyces niveus]|uniref:hypothetical protein n=1 Tax=Streptomyces niveus TaxID=193462 RepID=UPI0035E25CCD
MTRLWCWRQRIRHLGSTRLRLGLLVAAFAATTVTLLTSLPAYAEPAPTPSPSASEPAAGVPPAAGQRTPTPEEIERIEEFMREQGQTFSGAAQQKMLEEEKEKLRKALPDEGGILGVFNVTDATNMPISAYTIKGDTGGTFDWDLGIQNLLTELCFMVTKWLIAFCCWLIGWSLSFGLAKLLLAPVLSVANSLHTRVIMEMGLPSLFLAVCALVCTARIFFGDRAKGWGDAALSLLLAALATTMLVSTPQTLMGEEDGALAVTRGLALEVADVILDANPAAPDTDTDTDTGTATSATLSRPLTDALTDAFVVKPAMLLQYGRVFDGECAAKYSEAKLTQLAWDRQAAARMAETNKLSSLADFIDPSGSGVISSTINWQVDMTHRWVMDRFGNPPMEAFEADCVPGDIAAAKKASMDKVGGALFLLIAAGIVTVLIAGLAGSFLIAQARIAWDAVRGEPALIAGIVPGAGRAYLWDWGASVLRSLSQMLVSVIALAVFIVVVQAVLDPVQHDWGRELTLRFLVVDLICIAAVKKRQQIATRSREVASNFKAKMSTGRIGGTHGSILTTSSQPVAQRPRIARATARGIVRGAMVTTALAQGNPLLATAYALPQSLGATTLMYRMQSGGRRKGSRPVQPRNTPNRRPAPTPSTAAPAGVRTPVGAPQPPTVAPGHPPMPASPPRAPGRPGAAPRPPAGQGPARRHAPQHLPPVQPPASPRQRQLRQRLDRGPRRVPPRQAP